MKILIELYSGPGAGKSTTAAGLYYLMKCRGYDAEMVREFAKEKAWNGTLADVTDNEIIYSEQTRRELDMVDGPDVVITDSPIRMSQVYGTPEDVVKEHEAEMRAAGFNYIRLFVNRPEEFSNSGRIHNKEQSIEIDKTVRGMLEFHGEVDKNLETLIDFIENKLSTIEGMML